MTTPPTSPFFHTPPWQHQRDAFDFAFPRKAAMLALEMGTGKSKVVVDLILNRGHRKTLILCPLSVVPAWPKQFSLHGGGQVRCVDLGSGTIKARAEKAEEALKEGPAALVINYEAAKLAPFSGWAKNQPWSLVVADESHRAKNPSSATGKFLRSLTYRSQHRLCLTGTPMPHSPLDVWGQFAFLDPRIFSLWRLFKARYAVMGGYLDKQVIAYQNQEELQARFYEHSFRVRAEEVLDLPETLDVQRSFSLSPKAARLYRQLERGFWAQVESGEVTIGNALVKLLRLQQVTGGFVTTDEGTEEVLGTEKADLLADLLEDIPGEEPVVIFCRFRHDLEAVRKASFKSARETGELSGRKNDLAAWQRGEFPDLAVQIQSGGAGIDLTRARYCIYYSLGFSLGDYLQSRARLHRPGQERPVTYLHLTASGTVDEKVYRALEKRQQVVEAVLNREDA